MKNIYEILKGYGLEVPEDKKADFDKAWKENYRTISDYDKVVSQRDNYKTSLDCKCPTGRIQRRRCERFAGTDHKASGRFESER